MRKTILHCFICAALLSLNASCSKDVKKPSPKQQDTSAASTDKPGTTQPQNQDNNSHSCGNQSNPNSNGGYGG